jgi:hypothetical protein
MTRGWLTAVVGLIVAGVASVAAQTDGSRPTFTWERPIVGNGAGPRRLAVDVRLLAGANGDLTDLRLFDANGRETPYLLVYSPPVAPMWTPAAILRVAPVDTPKLKQSGFEADLGRLTTVDRFRIDTIGAQPFLKRAQLEASGDRAHWTLLTAESTLFDLPNEGLRLTEVAFTPGPYRYFRITWDDTNSARVPLPTSVSARMVPRAGASASILRAPLSVERRPSEPRRSRYRVRLPGPHLPIVALTFELGGGHVMRSVSVYEPRLAGTEVAPVQLGEATLKRVVQGSLVASSLDVPIRPPVEPQLDLVVEDGDNPPLEVQGISAVFAEQPWIYFESTGEALVARYGARRLTAPRYDLEAVRESLRATIDNVTMAAWGDAHAAAPDTAAAATIPSVTTIGAAVDASRFSFVRTLPPGDSGLVMLPLDAPALAHSAGLAGSFADVRVINDAEQQVPYLVERVSEPLSLPLTITKLDHPPASVDPQSDRRTVYRIDWPFEHLPSPRLVIATPARVFERTITVAVESEPDRYHRDRWLDRLARTTWAHVEQDAPATDLTLPLPQIESKSLLMIVDEGDNMPLPLTSARLLLPAYRLRFFRERGQSLRLVYGNTEMAPPRYDLALLAPQVLGVVASEISASDEQPPKAASSLPALVSPRLFWLALVIAVVVLLGLIVRLLKKEQPVSS